jgi:hypothetical protein
VEYLCEIATGKTVWRVREKERKREREKERKRAAD